MTWNAAAVRLFGHTDAVGKHVSLIVARQRLAAVADAAVVRRRDERWGEVPVAFVAFKPGTGARERP